MKAKKQKDLNEDFIKNNFLDSSFAIKTNIKHLIIKKNFQAKYFANMPNSLNDFFKAKIIAGGFGEPRNFYKIGCAKKQIHLGTDITLKSKTKIVSPTKGQLISSFWAKTATQTDQNVWISGLGGIVVAKYLINDLDINKSLKKFIYVKYKDDFPNDNKYIISKVPKFAFVFQNKSYFPPFDKRKNSKLQEKQKFFQTTKAQYEHFLQSYKKILNEQEYEDFFENQKSIVMTFMHLSKKTPNLQKGKIVEINKKTHHINFNQNVSYTKPKKIKKGEIIGYIGTFEENGNWPSHLHLNCNFYLKKPNSYFSFNLSKYYFENPPTSLQDFQNFWKTKHLGVRGANSNEIKNSKKLANFLSENGYFDPNNIFNFYDKKTPKVYLPLKKHN